MLVPLVLAALLLIGGSASSGAAGVNVSYLYNLSNFFGPLPYNWAVPFVDREKNEIFVLDTREGGLSVFNESGMETYRFEPREGMGGLLDGAIQSNGNIVLLASRLGTGRFLIRCDYRGTPFSETDIGKWAEKNLPAGYSGFSPDRIAIANDLIYLADRSRKKIVVMDGEGRLKSDYDLTALVSGDEIRNESSDIVGFAVDPKGNIYITVPTSFRAFRLSPDGKISGFGRPGSLPGAFGIAAGIGADGNGNIFVSDTLKCVVMVFDREFRFLAEFGSRGIRKGQLFAPKELAVDNKSRVYVTQAGGKGISVFQVSIN